MLVTNHRQHGAVSGLLQSGEFRPVVPRQLSDLPASHYTDVVIAGTEVIETEAMPYLVKYEAQAMLWGHPLPRRFVHANETEPRRIDSSLRLMTDVVLEELDRYNGGKHGTPKGQSQGDQRSHMSIVGPSPVRSGPALCPGGHGSPGNGV